MQLKSCVKFVVLFVEKRIQNIRILNMAKTLAEKIAVMQAAERGEEIQSL